MSAVELIHRANAAGVELRLDAAGGLKAAGDRQAIERLLPDLRAHKAEIARLLQDSQITVRALAAAMLICDRHGDDAAAREAMRQDVMQTPSHLMHDLLDHLMSQAPK